jgi:hypothetical protein
MTTGEWEKRKSTLSIYRKQPRNQYLPLPIISTSTYFGMELWDFSLTRCMHTHG